MKYGIWGREEFTKLVTISNPGQISYIDNDLMKVLVLMTKYENSNGYDDTALNNLINLSNAIDEYCKKQAKNINRSDVVALTRLSVSEQLLEQANRRMTQLDHAFKIGSSTLINLQQVAANLINRLREKDSGKWEPKFAERWREEKDEPTYANEIENLKCILTQNTSQDLRTILTNFFSNKSFSSSEPLLRDLGVIQLLEANLTAQDGDWFARLIIRKALLIPTNGELDPQFKCERPMECEEEIVRCAGPMLANKEAILHVLQNYGYLACIPRNTYITDLPTRLKGSKKIIDYSFTNNNIDYYRTEMGTRGITISFTKDDKNKFLGKEINGQVTLFSEENLFGISTDLKNPIAHSKVHGQFLYEDSKEEDYEIDTPSDAIPPSPAGDSVLGHELLHLIHANFPEKYKDAIASHFYDYANMRGIEYDENEKLDTSKMFTWTSPLDDDDLAREWAEQDTNILKEKAKKNTNVNEQKIDVNDQKNANNDEQKIDVNDQKNANSDEQKIDVNDQFTKIRKWQFEQKGRRQKLLEDLKKITPFNSESDSKTEPHAQGVKPTLRMGWHYATGVGGKADAYIAKQIAYDANDQKKKTDIMLKLFCDRWKTKADIYANALAEQDILTSQMNHLKKLIGTLEKLCEQDFDELNQEFKKTNLIKKELRHRLITMKLEREARHLDKSLNDVNQQIHYMETWLKTNDNDIDRNKLDNLCEEVVCLNKRIWDVQNMLLISSQEMKAVRLKEALERTHGRMNGVGNLRNELEELQNKIESGPEEYFDLKQKYSLLKDCNEKLEEIKKNIYDAERGVIMAKEDMETARNNAMPYIKKHPRFITNAKKRTYGSTNEYEDFATMGQAYFEMHGGGGNINNQDEILASVSKPMGDTLNTLFGRRKVYHANEYMERW